MSHLVVDSILPAGVYNRLIIDHDATERAELVELNFVEPHLLHRTSYFKRGKALVYRTLDIPGSGDVPGICVDVTKAVSCPKPIKSRLGAVFVDGQGDGPFQYSIILRSACRVQATTR